MDIDPQKFRRVKDEAETFYRSVEEVYCPHLRAAVTFDRRGFRHLMFKHDRLRRQESDQYLRFKYLQFAPRILSKSHTLQEFHETNGLERRQTNSRWERRLVPVRYYGFISIMEGLRFKVVVKQIGNGGEFFWSFMPFWKALRHKTPDLKSKKLLRAGDLEED